MIEPAALVPVIAPHQAEVYQARVEQVYADDPDLWKTAIGSELWFQFGVYHSDASTLDQAGRCYLDQQLARAGLTQKTRLQRILDIGFGWGANLAHLTRVFPNCPRLDGVNISTRQARYAAERLAAFDQVHLYLCNARDITLLPDPDPAYDLVLLRGSIGHMPPDVLTATLNALSTRTSPGAILLISETLYNVPLTVYESAIPDNIDRLACGHRKTSADIQRALQHSGFILTDSHVLPSNDDAIRWLTEIRSNIDRDLPPHPPQPLAELCDVAKNLSVALAQNTVAIYSIIARRGTIRQNRALSPKRW